MALWMKFSVTEHQHKKAQAQTVRDLELRILGFCEAFDLIPFGVEKPENSDMDVSIARQEQGIIPKFHFYVG